MGWFGSADLALQYGIVFGSLLLASIIGGLLKLAYEKRRLAAYIKKEEEERAAEPDKIVLTHKRYDEGDLFGIMALEAGFYGGVHQSRPVSAATSGFNTPMRAASPSPLGLGGRFLSDVDMKLTAAGGRGPRSHTSSGSMSTFNGGVAKSAYSPSITVDPATGAPNGSLVTVQQAIYRPFQTYESSPSASSASSHGSRSPSNSSTGSGSLPVGQGYGEPLAPGLYDPSRPRSGDEIADQSTIPTAELPGSSYHQYQQPQPQSQYGAVQDDNDQSIMSFDSATVPHLQTSPPRSSGRSLT